MKGIVIFVVCLLIGLAAADVNAENCIDQTAALRQAALEEFEKAKRNHREMLPDTEGYMSEVKRCIGSLSDWTASIGFKMPSVDQILRNMCEEVRSQVDIPKFEFKIDETIGVGNTRTRYEVSDEDAELVFREIWETVWEKQ
jgi:hypothetical protein